MKIYSWNMFCNNPTPERAFRYIEELDFDILCLQEVPEQFLDRLKTLPYEIAYGIDIVQVISRRQVNRNYVVILSKYPILSSEQIPFPDNAHRPLRQRFFVWSMRPIGMSQSAGRGSLYADIDAGDMGTFRVFSLHLNLAGPSRRARELSIVAKHLPKGYSAIVCGDFNVIEDRALKIVSWLLGSPISESLPWISERKSMEAFFNSMGLKNPLRGKVTHFFSGSQLDHILVPSEAPIAKTHVSTRGYGSDHRPIAIEYRFDAQKSTRPKGLKKSSQ